MIPLRLVLDTNIVVSAALKPDGLQRTVLLLALNPPARLHVSDAIVAEYRAVLARPSYESAEDSSCNFFSLSGTVRIRSLFAGRCR
jgi:predicted nucleic acid-binding protein